MVGTSKKKKNHSTSHMQHDKKDVTSGKTYLTPSLEGRGVKEREVLSHPEIAEHTNRRVQMLHLTSGALSFFFTYPRLFSHIYPKGTLGGGGLESPREQVSETKEV